MSACTEQCNQGRTCTCCLNQNNSDGSNPYAEAHDLVAIAMNMLAGGALFAFGVAVVIFAINWMGG